MSWPQCWIGRKVTDIVSRTPIVSRKTPYAAGVRNRKAFATTGEDGRDHRQDRLLIPMGLIKNHQMVSRLVVAKVFVFNLSLLFLMQLNFFLYSLCARYFYFYIFSSGFTLSTRKVSLFKLFFLRYNKLIYCNFC